MWITRLALKYPITTFMFAFAILVLGAVSFFQLPIDMLPDIQIPTVTVTTYYKGAGPSDMEQSITFPIERTVSSTTDIDYVQSSTREGISQVRVYFNWGANTNVGMVDIIQKINRAMNSLPTGTSQPMVLKFDITSQPVCQVAISGDIDQRDMYDLALNVIEPQLEHISGVASASVRGGRVREIQIRVDRNRIESMGIPITLVSEAIANSNLIVPSGDMKSGVFDYSLKTESQFSVVEPMGNIIIKTVNGIPIRIKDIGSVEDSYEEQTQLIRNNGKPGIVLRVQKTSGANTVNVVNQVVKAIASLRDVPPSVKATLAADQSLYIKQAIEGLLREGFLGALLAMIVILVFLRNGRSAGIIFLAIPLSILVTFIFFRFSGTSLNIMTLGGLALGIGRLVDDSIVELEVISRHYKEHQEKNITKLQATLDAALEVASPIFISTLTTVIVFLPVVFLEGISQMLFVPLVITITISLFASFFVSRTVTPLLCLHYLNPEKIIDPESKKNIDRLKIKLKNFFDAIDEKYHRILKYALTHRKLVVFGVFGISLASLLLYTFIGSEFFPEQDESQFSVSVRLPVGTRVEETEKFVEKIENIIQKNIPEVRTVISDIGAPSGSKSTGGGGNSGSHAASVSVVLVPPEERDRTVFEIIKSIRPKLTNLPGAQIIVNTGGFLKFLFNFGSSAPIDVTIFGHDFETANKLSQTIFDIVKTTSGASDVQISRELNLPEVRVRIDRDKAGALGVNVAQISNTIATGINGTVASTFTDPQTGNIYNILVRMTEDYRNKIDDIKKLTVKSSTGDLIQVGNVADIAMAKAPVQIDRKFQERIVSVTANTQGRDLGSIAKDIKARLAGVEIPSGFEVKITGNYEQQQNTFGGLLLAFALAIILVYMVMASQFQSLIDPFIIMFTVPLGVVGVLWALFLTGTTLSVTSFEGIIVMVGIVVSNGILLVDYMNRLRKRGVELHEAVIQAGRTRLRPILMTTLATVLGLIPLAMGLGGESSQAPLAIAVIGGLTVSTILTLLFVPTLYTIFEEKFKRKEIKTDE
jgi:CzcA family heavy metal efflux pump